MLHEGIHCWKWSEARRGRFLIDGAEYYADLADSLLQARRDVFILGWDFDSRIALVPDKPLHPACCSLGDFLTSLVTAREALRIYILIWVGSPLYVLDRQLFPATGFGAEARGRIRFVLDDHHPFSASHHQKVVVIDDEIAYCGGLDLTHNRWDCKAHAAHDRLRLSPRGIPYSPFHDVQARVEGPVAHVLGQLARERWRQATGETVPCTGPHSISLDESEAFDFYQARVGVVRTSPAFMENAEVRETEALLLAMISGAKQSLYIENQYFACQGIGDALIESLKKPVGPEIIIVLPSRRETWIEARAMGGARNEMLQTLKQADHYGRLGVFVPRLPGVAEGLKVHSKVVIADGRLALVGSPNLNRRSMGLDTECSLVFDGREDEGLAEALRRLQHSLIGEHLGQSSEEIAKRHEQHKSYLEVIRMKRRSARCLEPFHMPDTDWITEALQGIDIVDLTGPLAVERAFNGVLASFYRALWRPAGRALFWLGSLLGVTLLSLGIWYSLEPRSLGEFDWLANISTFWPLHDLPPLVALAAFLLGSLLFIPVNLLILAAASALDVYQAIFYAICGGMMYASMGYGIGRIIGKKRINRFIFGHVDYVARRLSGVDIKPLVYSRFLLWVPFAVVNMIAGAAQVGFAKYFVGTLIGLLPGTLALAVFQYNALEFFVAPNPWNAVLCMVVLFLIWKWIKACQRRMPVASSRHFPDRHSTAWLVRALAGDRS